MIKVILYSGGQEVKRWEDVRDVELGKESGVISFGCGERLYFVHGTYIIEEIT